MNILSDDLLDTIYKYKHVLELSDTLDYIKNDINHIEFENEDRVHVKYKNGKNVFYSKNSYTNCTEVMSYTEDSYNKPIISSLKIILLD